MLLDWGLFISFLGVTVGGGFIASVVEIVRHREPHGLTRPMPSRREPETAPLTLPYRR